MLSKKVNDLENNNKIFQIEDCVNQTNYILEYKTDGVRVCGTLKQGFKSYEIQGVIKPVFRYNPHTKENVSGKMLFFTSIDKTGVRYPNNYVELIECEKNIWCGLGQFLDNKYNSSCISSQFGKLLASLVVSKKDVMYNYPLIEEMEQNYKKLVYSKIYNIYFTFNTSTFEKESVRFKQKTLK